MLVDAPLLYTEVCSPVASLLKGKAAHSSVGEVGGARRRQLPSGGREQADRLGAPAVAGERPASGWWTLF